MKKSVIYARQSFGAEDGSASIDVQIDQCRRWALAHGVEVCAVYQDANCSSELYPGNQEGIEASRVDRGYQMWRNEQLTKVRKDYKHGLGEALDYIKANRPDYILVYTSNRLGRSATSSNLNNFLTAYLMEHNCSIVDVQSNSITDFSDKLMMAFRAMKDALDYQGVAEKRKASMESVSRRINSYRKYSNAVGVAMQDGQVTISTDYLPLIQAVFSGIASGMSYSAVLAMLNRDYRRLARGRQWYMTNIYHMAHNPVYAGYMANRDGVIGRATNIPHPAISYSLYSRVQAIMDTKRTNAGKYNTAGERRHFLPLSGYLYCGCGRRMTVFFDRGKLAYHCINGNDHTCTMYITDDVLLTVQQICIISCIDSRRRLAALSKSSDRADALRCGLERLQASLRAKFRLVETDEDAELYKPDIQELKDRIKSAKNELLQAEAHNAADADALQEQVEHDFASIMERRMLDNDDYMRLMQDTIDRITVHDDNLEVITRQGVTINVPRIGEKHRARRLMRCTLLCDTSDDIDGISHYQMHFYGGDEPQILGGTCQYEDGNISVWIH